MSDFNNPWGGNIWGEGNHAYDRWFDGSEAAAGENNSPKKGQTSGNNEVFSLTSGVYFLDITNSIKKLIRVETEYKNVASSLKGIIDRMCMISLGKTLWEKYVNGTTDDIILLRLNRTYVDPEGHEHYGRTSPFINSFPALLMADGQIYQKDSDSMSDFHGIKIKFDVKARVHLICLFNKTFINYKEDSVMGIKKQDIGGETLFHELKLHVDFDPEFLLRDDRVQQHVIGGLGTIGNEMSFYLNKAHYIQRTGIQIADNDTSKDWLFLSTKLEEAVIRLKELWSSTPKFTSDYLSEARMRNESLYEYLKELLKF